MDPRPAAKKPAPRVASEGPAPLAPAMRRELRARAHHLHPLVTIGQHGLSPQVLHELDVALTAHELVKLRVFSDDRALRETLFARICAELACAPVQHIGKLLILWRPPDEPPVPAKAAPAKAGPTKATPAKPIAAQDRRLAATEAAPPKQRQRATGASAPSGVPRAAMPRRRRTRTRSDE